jgi:hypothetical protein
MADKVAIVSDSASDIPPQLAAELGITIVPIIVSFNEESFKVGEEISMDEFWKRLTAPGAPFPKTAAPSAAAFTAAYDKAFASGASEIVSVHVASKLSATYRSAEMAATAHPQSKNIHLVNDNKDKATIVLELLVDRERYAIERVIVRVGRARHAR